MPPDEMVQCSGLGEGAAPGIFGLCANVATGWRVITLDHWAVRVFLCSAHATLWNADIGHGNSIPLRPKVAH